jgi:hypothetical protein
LIISWLGAKTERIVAHRISGAKVRNGQPDIGIKDKQDLGESLSEQPYGRKRGTKLRYDFVNSGQGSTIVDMFYGGIWAWGKIGCARRKPGSWQAY